MATDFLNELDKAQAASRATMIEAGRYINYLRSIIESLLPYIPKTHSWWPGLNEIIEGTEPIARPLETWSEQDGEVTWWKFPIEEAPFIGSPNGSDWPGYHTHWTPCPSVPRLRADPSVPPECKINDWCILGEGHTGGCNDIPF